MGIRVLHTGALSEWTGRWRLHERARGGGGDRMLNDTAQRPE